MEVVEPEPGVQGLELEVELVLAPARELGVAWVPVQAVDLARIISPLRLNSFFPLYPRRHL